MTSRPLYPPSPKNIPDKLTKPKASYKRQAWLAMMGLCLFMIIYLALTGFFGYITYTGIMKISSEGGSLGIFIFTICAGLLSVFMAKSLFVVKKAGNPGGIEVNAKQEPELVSFLHKLADEVGAPKPHRIFITPEVNAAVFYDLTLLNLIFPSRKNLIIGLGLVNVLNLGELKAVLAHEFGHFAQGTMVVGRWVYIAQQIIAHMVATRDWLDKIVRFISRFDIRVAWIGWLLALIIWSIRSLMDTLFSLVVMAERALSREMEFNADLVAVSVTGSDALVNALSKLQAADHAWQTALDIAGSEAASGKGIDDLFKVQNITIDEMRRVLNDQEYGAVPPAPEGIEPEAHRVFEEQTARPPQMWSTHPENQDREENAKQTYIAMAIDERSAWNVFSDPQAIRQAISGAFYKQSSEDTMQPISPLEAVIKRFNRESYSPEYRGTYLSRNPIRNFESVDELLTKGTIKKSAEQSIAALYPESISDQLERSRNLASEIGTLEALDRGDLKPSGGVIRHRGEELKKSDIADVIESIKAEQQTVEFELMEHDASCRRGHIQLAEELGQGWAEYLKNLIQLLHCVEHLRAVTENEQALLVNTWMVITADGQIGYFEKKRMLAVCKKVEEKMREVSAAVSEITLPDYIQKAIGLDDWVEQRPKFEIAAVDSKNWPDWAKVVSDINNGFINALSFLDSELKERLIQTESMLRQNAGHPEQLQPAPELASTPSNYPVLMPGKEHVLQRKLDLWNRFQLAHGLFPTLARLIVSIAVVGGTLAGAFIMLFA